jgi:hypothetical protein
VIQHCSIHKFVCTDVSGKTYSQIDYILTDRRCLIFQRVDCDTDHYLVVVKVRERLAVWKQATQKFHMESFSLKRLKKVGG